MKVQPINTAIKTAYEQRPMKKPQAPLQEVVKDRVDISFEGWIRRYIEENINAADEQRKQKIQDLREEINQGRYELNEKVLDYVIENILAQGII